MPSWRVPRWGLALLVTAVLIGCEGVLPTIPVATEADIEAWVSQEEYARALAGLQRRRLLVRSEQDQTRLQEVRTLAEAYDQRMAEAALEAEAAGDPARANLLLDEAADKYPQGSRVREARREIRAAREAQAEKLESRLLLARARWLQDSIPLFKKWVEADPDNLDAAWKLEQALEESIYTATALEVIGLELMANKRTRAAKEYLSASHALMPSKKVETELEAIARREAAKARQAKRRQDQKQARIASLAAEQKRRQANDLVVDSRAAIEGAEYDRAGQLIDELEQLDRQHPRLSGLRSALKNAVQIHLRNLVEQGNRLYTDGQIEGAKALWEEALRLDPDNVTVREHVARADRVLSKLREIQDQEAADAP